MKKRFTAGLALALLLLGVGAASGQAPGWRKTSFSFEEFLLAPLRIHLLSSSNAPAIHTTLTKKDINRILGKINGVWSQAGLHFYLESLIHEAAAHQNFYAQTGKPSDGLRLLGLRPNESKASNMFHIYYVKEMGHNGIYFPEGMFVKDTASLRRVEGGIDEPLPRVSSHELGHALTLPHRQDSTNLMASGTTGTWLNHAEIQQAREAAAKRAWIEPAPAAMKKAIELRRQKQFKEARLWFARIAALPVKEKSVEQGQKRTKP